MYENFYGFKEKPFQITPNPKYLYMSPLHENALTYLEYGLMENVGFILLTGKVGTGKTTLVRHIMDQYETEKEIAVIFNTNVSTDELISLILQAFDLVPEIGNKSKSLEYFYKFLIKKYAENKHVLLIIDEAQNLSDEALEEVRMLSNLQSDDQNLIQIMLVGQPELKDRLQQPGHNPFAQRIAANFFLSELNYKETKAYITYRLEKAGGRPDIFNQQAEDMIYKSSGGIPRSINLLCDSALVYGFGYELEIIDASVIEQVIKDKGGMGLDTVTERRSFFSSAEPGDETDDGERLQRLEDLFKLLQPQVDFLIEKMEGLEEKINVFKEDINHKVIKLLLEDREKNDKLLVAYTQLKTKYENLLKSEKRNN